MSDFGTMHARIAREIKRTNLTAEIKDAIRDAIEFFEKDKNWWFLEARATASTQQNERFYPTPIDYRQGLRLKIERNNAVTPVTEITWAEIEEYDSSTNPGTVGLPVYWAYFDRNFRLWPVPDGVYLLTLSYIRDLPDLTEDSDTNEWMTIGARLIRSRAKQELFRHVIRNHAEADKMEKAAAEAYEVLTRQHVQQVTTGRVTATYF